MHTPPSQPPVSTPPDELMERVQELLRGPLTTSLYRPNPVELDFLHKTINPDDEKLKQMIVELQQECVHMCVNICRDASLPGV